MKAKKALKRLAKIEALISDVTERFSNTSLQIRGALKDAKAAFARVQEAVSIQASSEAAKDSAPAGKVAKKTAPALVAKSARKKPPKWNAAQREAAAERMRLRWAAKKKAEVKPQSKAGSKANKTATAA
jgi:hypothetical protein